MTPFVIVQAEPGVQAEVHQIVLICCFVGVDI
jgi:hypothetical protein